MPAKLVFTLVLPPNKPEKLVLAKKTEESLIHIVLKILAYLIFYNQKLKIEKRLAYHYKPDLVKEGPNGRPEIWIDCGKISVKKLDKLATSLGAKGLVVVVKKDREELLGFKRQADKKLRYPQRVKYISFSNNLVEKISNLIVQRHNNIIYNCKGRRLSILFNNEKLKSEVLFL